MGAEPEVGEAGRPCGRRQNSSPFVLIPLLATIEKGLVLRKLGRLQEEDRWALREVLDDILG